MRAPDPSTSSRQAGGLRRFLALGFCLGGLAIPGGGGDPGWGTAVVSHR